MTKNQQGFSLILPLVIIILLGAVAGAAYLSFQQSGGQEASSSTPTTRSSILPAATPSNMNSALDVRKFNPLLPTEGKVNDLQLTIIDQTTDEQIAKMLDLKEKRVLANGVTEYVFAGYLSSRDHLVQSQSGKASYERIPLASSGAHPTISDFLKKYGEAEKKYIGSKYFPTPFETVYAYPSRGISVTGNPATDEIDEIQVFKPTSLENFEKSWNLDYLPKPGPLIDSN